MPVSSSVPNALADYKANTQTSLSNDPNARQLQPRLDGLARRQEELQEVREEALINREVLSESRQHMREQRARTAKVEVTLMNAFRQHYNQISQSIPEGLAVAYKAVDEERNKLGNLEDEYLQVEEEQGTLEWNLTDLESGLYQYGLRDIFPETDVEEHSVPAPEYHVPAPRFSEPMSPSTAVQYQVATTELEGLVQRFMKLRQQISERLISATVLSVEDADLVDIGSTEFVRSFLDLLDQIIDTKVRVQHLKATMIQYGTAPLEAIRSFSEPSIFSKDKTSPKTVPRARSNGSLSQLEDDDFIVHHIRDWLVDCLKENVVQRVQYLSTLHEALNYMDLLLPDVAQWEALVRQHWASDEVEHLVRSISVIPSVFQGHNPSLQDNDSDSALYPSRPDGAYVSHNSQTTRLGLDNTALLRGITSSLASWTECSIPASIDLTNEGTLDIGTEAGHQAPGNVPNASQSSATDLWMARCDSADDWGAAKISGTTSPPTVGIVDEQSQPHVSEVVDSVQTNLEALDASLLTPGLTYSHWTWSVELKREFCYGFLLDTIVEVLWLEGTISKDMDKAIVSNVLSHASRDILQAEPQNNELDYSVVPFEPLYNSCLDFCFDYSNTYRTCFQFIASEHQDGFYVKGRVFDILWAQNNKDMHSKGIENHLQAAKVSQQSVYETQRFVIIRNKQTFSQCIPIQSRRDYRPIGSGSMLDYGILYTSEYPPKPRPRERLLKHPIRVRPAKGGDLPEESRANFGKTYAIQHDHLVSDVGLVVGEQIYLLQLYSSMSYE